MWEVVPFTGAHQRELDLSFPVRSSAGVLCSAPRPPWPQSSRNCWQHPKLRTSPLRAYVLCTKYRLVARCHTPRYYCHSLPPSFFPRTLCFVVPPFAIDLVLCCLAPCSVIHVVIVSRYLLFTFRQQESYNQLLTRPICAQKDADRQLGLGTQLKYACARKVSFDRPQSKILPSRHSFRYSRSNP